MNKITPEEFLNNLETDIPLTSTGIYILYCFSNKKIYIGQTRSKDGFTKRFSFHLAELRHNKHRNDYLQHTWNKYGEENFILRPIEEINRAELREVFLEREEYYISLFEKQDLFNLILTPSNISFTEETLERMSKAQKKRAEKYGPPMKGRKLTSEQIEHLRTIFSGERNPMFGKTHSEEARNKISAINKGRKMSEEARRNISEGHKGIIQSEETRRKNSLSKIGKKRSPETIEKLKQHRPVDITREATSIKRQEEWAIKELNKLNRENTKENIDFLIQGRYGGLVPLTEELVLEARRLKATTNMTYSEIADKLKVIKKSIQAAVIGETWNHLPNIYLETRKKS